MLSASTHFSMYISSFDTSLVQLLNRFLVCLCISNVHFLKADSLHTRSSIQASLCSPFGELALSILVQNLFYLLDLWLSPKVFIQPYIDCRFPMKHFPSKCAPLCHLLLPFDGMLSIYKAFLFLVQSPQHFRKIFRIFKVSWHIVNNVSIKAKHININIHTLVQGRKTTHTHSIHMQIHLRTWSELWLRSQKRFNTGLHDNSANSALPLGSFTLFCHLHTNLCTLTHTCTWPLPIQQLYMCVCPSDSVVQDQRPRGLTEAHAWLNMRVWHRFWPLRLWDWYFWT